MKPIFAATASLLGLLAACTVNQAATNWFDTWFKLTPELAKSSFASTKVVGQSGKNLGATYKLTAADAKKLPHVTAVDITYRDNKPFIVELTFTRSTTAEVALAELGQKSAKADPIEYFTSPDEAKEQREAGNSGSKWEGYRKVTGLKAPGKVSVRFLMRENSDPTLEVELETP